MHTITVFIIALYRERWEACGFCKSQVSCCPQVDGALMPINMKISPYSFSRKGKGDLHIHRPKVSKFYKYTDTWPMADRASFWKDNHNSLCKRFAYCNIKSTDAKGQPSQDIHRLNLGHKRIEVLMVTGMNYAAFGHLHDTAWPLTLC